MLNNEKKQKKNNNNNNNNLPTSWLFKLGKSFLSAAKHGAKFKSNWQCCAALHAMYCGWLALTVTESRSVQPYITTRNYTDCEWPKNADLVASCALRNLTISQPNYHQNTSKYICNIKNNVYSRWYRNMWILLRLQHSTSNVNKRN